jgi:hypothetical protein
MWLCIRCLWNSNRYQYRCCKQIKLISFSFHLSSHLFLDNRRKAKAALVSIECGVKILFLYFWLCFVQVVVKDDKMEIFGILRLQRVKLFIHSFFSTFCHLTTRSLIRSAESKISHHNFPVREVCYKNFHSHFHISMMLNVNVLHSITTVSSETWTLKDVFFVVLIRDI